MSDKSKRIDITFYEEGSRGSSCVEKGFNKVEIDSNPQMGKFKLFFLFFSGFTTEAALIEKKKRIILRILTPSSHFK